MSDSSSKMTKQTPKIFERTKLPSAKAEEFIPTKLPSNRASARSSTNEEAAAKAAVSSSRGRSLSPAKRSYSEVASVKTDSTSALELSPPKTSLIAKAKSMTKTYVNSKTNLFKDLLPSDELPVLKPTTKGDLTKDLLIPGPKVDLAERHIANCNTTDESGYFTYQSTGIIQLNPAYIVVKKVVRGDGKCFYHAALGALATHNITLNDSQLRNRLMMRNNRPEYSARGNVWAPLGADSDFAAAFNLCVLTPSPIGFRVLAGEWRQGCRVVILYIAKAHWDYGVVSLRLQPDIHVPMKYLRDPPGPPPAVPKPEAAPPKPPRVNVSITVNDDDTPIMEIGNRPPAPTSQTPTITPHHGPIPKLSSMRDAEIIDLAREAISKAELMFSREEGPNPVITEVEDDEEIVTAEPSGSKPEVIEVDSEPEPLGKGVRIPSHPIVHKLINQQDGFHTVDNGEIIFNGSEAYYPTGDPVPKDEPVITRRLGGVGDSSALEDITYDAKAAYKDLVKNNLDNGVYTDYELHRGWVAPMFRDHIIKYSNLTEPDLLALPKKELAWIIRYGCATKVLPPSTTGCINNPTHLAHAAPVLVRAFRHLDPTVAEECTTKAEIALFTVVKAQYPDSEVEFDYTCQTLGPLRVLKFRHDLPEVVSEPQDYADVLDLLQSFFSGSNFGEVTASVTANLINLAAQIYLAATDTWDSMAVGRKAAHVVALVSSVVSSVLSIGRLINVSVNGNFVRASLTQILTGTKQSMWTLVPQKIVKVILLGFCMAGFTNVSKTVNTIGITLKSTDLLFREVTDSYESVKSWFTGEDDALANSVDAIVDEMANLVAAPVVTFLRAQHCRNVTNVLRRATELSARLGTIAHGDKSERGQTAKTLQTMILRSINSISDRREQALACDVQNYVVRPEPIFINIWGPGGHGKSSWIDRVLVPWLTRTFGLQHGVCTATCTSDYTPLVGMQEIMILDEFLAAGAKDTWLKNINALISSSATNLDAAFVKNQQPVYQFVITISNVDPANTVLAGSNFTLEAQAAFRSRVWSIFYINPDYDDTKDRFHQSKYSTTLVCNDEELTVDAFKDEISERWAKFNNDYEERLKENTQRLLERHPTAGTKQAGGGCPTTVSFNGPSNAGKTTFAIKVATHLSKMLKVPFYQPEGLNCQVPQHPCIILLNDMVLSNQSLFLSWYDRMTPDQILITTNNLPTKKWKPGYAYSYITGIPDIEYTYSDKIKETGIWRRLGFNKPTYTEGMTTETCDSGLFFEYSSWVAYYEGESHTFDDVIYAIASRLNTAPSNSRICEVVTLPMLEKPDIKVHVKSFAVTDFIAAYGKPEEGNEIKVSAGGPTAGELHAIFEDLADGKKIDEECIKQKLDFVAARYPQWTWDINIPGFAAIIDQKVYVVKADTGYIRHFTDERGYTIDCQTHISDFNWEEVKILLKGNPYTIPSFVKLPAKAQAAVCYYASTKLINSPYVQSAATKSMVTRMRENWRTLLDVYARRVWQWICDHKISVIITSLLGATAVITAIAFKKEAKAKLIAEYDIMEHNGAKYYNICIPGEPKPIAFSTAIFQSGPETKGEASLELEPVVRNNRKLRRKHDFDKMEEFGVSVRGNPNRIKDYRDAWIEEYVDAGKDYEEAAQYFDKHFQSFQDKLENMGSTGHQGNCLGKPNFQAISAFKTTPKPYDVAMDDAMAKLKEATCYIQCVATGMRSKGLFIKGRYVLSNSHIFVASEYGPQKCIIYDNERLSGWNAEIHNSIEDRDITVSKITDPDFRLRPNITGIFVNDDDLLKIHNIRVLLVDNTTSVLMGGGGKMEAKPILIGNNRMVERAVVRDKRGNPYPTFTTFWTQSRDIPTQNGDCGSPYLAAEKCFGARKVFAIHSVGDKPQLVTRGAVVTQQDLDLLLSDTVFQSLPTRMREFIDVIPIENPLPTESTVKKVIRVSDAIAFGLADEDGNLQSLPLELGFNIEDTDRFKQIGYSKKAYRPSGGKTKYRAGPFKDLTNFPIETIPAVTSTRSLDQDAVDKLATKAGVPSLIGTQIRHLATKQFEMDKDILKEVEDHIQHKYAHIFGDYTILNDFEVKNGVLDPERPHYDYIHQIDGNKSVGALGIKHKIIGKKNYLKTVQQLDGSYHYYWDNDTPHGVDLQEQFRAIERFAKIGIHLIDPIEARVKDELLPIYKAKTGKVRLFENVSFPTFLFQRKYLGHFIAQAQKHHIDIPWVTGYDPLKEGCDIYEKLKQVSDVGEAADAGRFDKTVPLQVQNSSTNIMAWWANLTREEKIAWLNNVFSVIFEQNSRELHFAEGVFYWTNGSFNSGCFGTNFLDGLFNLIIHYYCGAILLKPHVSGNVYEYMDKNSRVFFNGDDIVRAITPEMGKHFNFNTLKVEYAKFGMDYTAPSKDGSNPPDLIFIEDMEFSSRIFRKEGTIIYNPLKKISIQRLFHWMKMNSDETIGRLLSAGIEEAFHWGKEYYSMYINDVIHCKKKYLELTGSEFDIPIVSYNTYKKQYFSSIEFAGESPVKWAPSSMIEISPSFQAIKHKNMSFICFSCNVETTTALALQNHVVNSHPDSTDGYACSSRWCTFVGTPRMLKQHNCGWTGRVKCGDCQTVYKNYDTAANHHFSAHARNRGNAADYFTTVHNSLHFLDRPVEPNKVERSQPIAVPPDQSGPKLREQPTSRATKHQGLYLPLPIYDPIGNECQCGGPAHGTDCRCLNSNVKRKSLGLSPLKYECQCRGINHIPDCRNNTNPFNTYTATYSSLQPPTAPAYMYPRVLTPTKYRKQAAEQYEEEILKTEYSFLQSLSSSAARNSMASSNMVNAVPTDLSIPRGTASSGAIADVPMAGVTLDPASTVGSHQGEAVPAITLNMDAMAATELPTGIPSLIGASGPANDYLAQIHRAQVVAEGNLTSLSPQGQVICKYIYGTKQTYNKDLLNYIQEHADFGGSTILNLEFSSNPSLSGIAIIGWLPSAPGGDESRNPSINDLMRNNNYELLALQGSVNKAYVINDIRRLGFWRKTSEILDANDPANYAVLATRPRLYLAIYTPVQNFVGSGEVYLPWKAVSCPVLDGDNKLVANNWNGRKSDGGANLDLDLDYLTTQYTQRLCVDGTRFPGSNLALTSIYDRNRESNNNVDFNGSDPTAISTGSTKVFVPNDQKGYYAFKDQRDSWGVFFNGKLPTGNILPFTGFENVINFINEANNFPTGGFVVNSTVDLNTWVPSTSVPAGWQVTVCEDAFPRISSPAINSNYGRYYRYTYPGSGITGTIQFFKTVPSAAFSSEYDFYYRTIPSVVDVSVVNGSKTIRNGLKCVRFGSNVINTNAGVANGAPLAYQPNTANNSNDYIRGWVSGYVSPTGYVVADLKEYGNTVGQIVIDYTIQNGAVVQPMAISYSDAYAQRTMTGLSLSQPLPTSATSNPQTVRDGVFTPVPSIGMANAIERVLRNMRYQDAIDEVEEEYDQSAGAMVFGASVAGLGQGLMQYATMKVSNHNKMALLDKGAALKQQNTAAGRRYASTQIGATDMISAPPSTATKFSQTPKGPDYTWAKKPVFTNKPAIKSSGAMKPTGKPRFNDISKTIASSQPKDLISNPTPPGVRAHNHQFTQPPTMNRTPAQVITQTGTDLNMIQHAVPAEVHAPPRPAANPVGKVSWADETDEDSKA